MMKWLMIAVLGVMVFVLWQDVKSKQDQLDSMRAEIQRLESRLSGSPIRLVSPTAPTSAKAPPSWFAERLREKPALETARDRFQTQRAYEGE